MFIRFQFSTNTSAFPITTITIIIISVIGLAGNHVIITTMRYVIIIIVIIIISVFRGNE